MSLDYMFALTFLVVQSWLDGGTEECLAGRALQHVTVHINPAILGAPERGEDSGFASPFQAVVLLRKSFSLRIFTQHSLFMFIAYDIGYDI